MEECECQQSCFFDSIFCINSFIQLIVLIGFEPRLTSIDGLKNKHWSNTKWVGPSFGFKIKPTYGVKGQKQLMEVCL